MEELKACNFTKSNTPPWVFFVIFKLNKWYQITQNILYDVQDTISIWLFTSNTGHQSIRQIELITHKIKVSHLYRFTK